MCAFRHEFLGPDPRIVAYRVVGDEIHVEWRDEFMQVCWIDGGYWEVELELDKAVEAYYVADRNVYDG